MNKEHLLKTAGQLQQVSLKSVEEFSSKRDHLVSVMNQTMLARPDLLAMVGEGNVEMMNDNHANHARFLESIFKQHQPEVLVDTVLWVFRAYRSRNFASTYWAAQLNTWIEIYRKELSPECFSEVYPYYNWMQINIPIFNKLAEDVLDAPLSAH
ncbi:MAG: hypothetical protein JW735_01610 [Prolixibacteraceae bacterium]|jgi:hypothetical protein|nr:hypothetical protein [Prolixibacteraceae bacterium]